MTVNNISHAIKALLLLVCWICGTAVYASTPVSFLANIDPDSSQTIFTIQVGAEQVSSNDLNSRLRPGGGSVLRVTSIHGFLSDGLKLPADPHYALIFLGAMQPRNAIRDFGAGTLVLTGSSTSQITFDPGLLVNLLPNESLTLRSQTQSNHAAKIEVRGFLESLP